MTHFSIHCSIRLSLSLVVFLAAAVGASGIESTEPTSLGEPEGACCIQGVCIIVDQDTCKAAGGTYQGNNTSCDPNPCTSSPVGACCVAGTFCVIVNETTCAATGGVYQGDGTSCDPDPCGVVPTNPGSWGEIKDHYR